MTACIKCGVEKEESEFPFYNKAKGLRRKSCSDCNKAYQKGHYEDNKGSYIARAKSTNTERGRRYRARNKEYILQYLLEHPCVDCGESDVEVLEFDHVEMLNSTRGRITQFMKASLETLKQEIAKCEVRCANCHTRRTRRQMGWARG